MAGYIGNKAVGLNVTTGDILGDVGVGGVLTTTAATVFNGGFGSSKASNVIAADGAAANAFAMQIHNLEATANQSFGLYIQAGSGSDQALKIADHDAANDLFTLTGAGVATIKNGLTLTDGNLVVASGHGIDFAATGDISGTGSELLDDYETGTFQPSVTFGGASSGVQYVSNRRYGIYTKIGNVVTYFVHVELTNKGSSAGGANITGMPFTATNANNNQNYVPGSSFISSMASLSSNLMIRSLSGTTNLDIYQINSSHTYSTVTNANYTNTTGIQVSGVYFV